MVIFYDSSVGIVQSAFFQHFAKTIIPMVVCDKEFWIFLILNLTVFVLTKSGLYQPTLGLNLPFGLTGTTGGLMTFFVVFYNGHVFGRYNDLYDRIREMFEVCVYIAHLLRVNIRDERARWKVGKLTLAATFIFCYERTDHPEDEAEEKSFEFQDGTSMKEWATLNALGLLNESETKALMDHCAEFGENAMPSQLCMQWSIEFLRHATEDPDGRFDMLDGLCGCYNKLWRMQQEVVYIMELPMPFQYFHIMNMMLFLNLTLWAYSLALQESYFVPFLFAFVQMMFQGIRELATSLSNPFGSDEVDFPMVEWMIDTYSKVFSILSSLGEDELVSSMSQKPMQRPYRAQTIIDMNIDTPHGE